MSATLHVDADGDDGGRDPHQAVLPPDTVARESETLLPIGSSSDVAAAAPRPGPLPPLSSAAVPALAWVQLGFAVLAISTAAVAFRELPDIPPFLLASWRMQSTSVVLALGAGYQGWRERGSGMLLRWVRSAPLMLVSGGGWGSGGGDLRTLRPCSLLCYPVPSTAPCPLQKLCIFTERRSEVRQIHANTSPLMLQASTFLERSHVSSA